MSHSYCHRGVPHQINEMIEELLMNECENLDAFKLVVHFYHEPMDLEEPSILESNRILLEKGIKILWVHNSSNDNFQIKILNKIESGQADLCCFKKMPKHFKNIPINFTVVSPFNDSFNLIYIRLPGDSSIKFGIKIQSHKDLSKLFNNIAIKCLSKLDKRENSGSWNKLIVHAQNLLVE